MAADNNLDVAGRNDIEKELMTASLSDRTNVFVRFDRRKPLPWETDAAAFRTQRFRIKKREKQEIKDLGETNTGNPNTLKAFLSESMSSSAADHHLAIVWGHGGNIVPNMNFKDEGYKWVGIDDSSGDALSISEIVQAFTALPSKLNTIGFDACLMAVFELAYGLKDNAETLVFSQEIEPADGWPYHEILPLIEEKSLL